MKVIATDLPEVLILEPQLLGDQRGFFLECFQAKRYAEAGISRPFVQDNMSRSRYGVLRGLHLQNPVIQGKLVSVMRGRRAAVGRCRKPPGLWTDLMRIFLTGTAGQVGGALLPLLERLGTVVAPKLGEFDFSKPDTLTAILDRAMPNLIVNPAAYTAVDRAEDERETRFFDQRQGAGCDRALGSYVQRADGPFFDRLCVRRFWQRSATRGQCDRAALRLRREQIGRRQRCQGSRRGPPDRSYLLGLCGGRRQLPADDGPARRRTHRTSRRGRPNRSADDSQGHLRCLDRHFASRHAEYWRSTDEKGWGRQRGLRGRDQLAWIRYRDRCRLKVAGRQAASRESDRHRDKRVSYQGETSGQFAARLDAAS